MKFFNNDIFSNPGDPIHIIYAPVVNEDGSVDLVESGKENTDEIIQSYAESCDLSVIIQRFMNGETEVLSRNVPSYGDFTDVPKTFAEVLQKRIDAEKLFYSLPVDVRSKFANDPNQFFAQAGSKEWNDIVSSCFKSDTEDVKPVDVKSVESDVKEGVVE